MCYTEIEDKNNVLDIIQWKECTRYYLEFIGGSGTYGSCNLHEYFTKIEYLHFIKKQLEDFNDMYP